MTPRISIVAVVVSLIGGCALGQSTCTARTPESALPPAWAAQANHQPSPPESRESTSRYRLARMVVDLELHRRWAFIANCTHPEWPLQVVAIGPALTPLLAHAVETSTSSAAPPAPIPATRTARLARGTPPLAIPQSTIRPQSVRGSVPLPVPESFPVAPLVRAGDLVHLWSSDSSVHLDLEVVSLEYGRVGQVIRLRRLGQSALLAGVVVGKDSAELVP